MHEHPEVATSSGTVRGRTEHGCAVFRGIPFAAPPVGVLRFQAPAPAASWDGVREADAFGPPVPQAFPAPPAGSDPVRTPPPPPGGPVRHDPTDWLTLNIWTPDTSAAAAGGGLPVMVYVYGGAYRLGTSGTPDLDGVALAAHGVVVVTANHRVGIEGYALLDGAPANRGLLDQVAVLEWVQENVAAFGGDAGRVVVFGESAGAGAVASLLVMPRARGLFAGAIAQSVPGTFFTPELARDISIELLRPLGLAPEASALADRAPDQLIAALTQLDRRMPGLHRWGMVAHTPTPYSPVVDGDVLPVDPWTGLARGDAAGTPLVVGHNRDEWQLFLLLGGLLGQVTDEIAAGAVAAFGPGPDVDVRAAFPAVTAEQLMSLTLSDRMFRMPSLQLAEAQTAGGGRAHLYELTWSSPVMGGVLGACHALDVPLVFGNLTAPGMFPLLPAPPTAEVQDISRTFQRAWTAFAASGHPGWPAWSGSAATTYVVDAGARGGVLPYPEQVSRQLWEGRLPRVLDLV